MESGSHEAKHQRKMSSLSLEPRVISLLWVIFDQRFRSEYILEVRLSANPIVIDWEFGYDRAEGE